MRRHRNADTNSSDEWNILKGRYFNLDTSSTLTQFCREHQAQQTPDLNDDKR